CPLGGGRADAQACSFVGSYSVNGTGNVSDSILISVEPDYFWYYEKTHIYCVSNQYGSKCLNTTNYDFGTWSVVAGQFSGGVSLDRLTFTPGNCTTFGTATTGSGGASGTGNGGNAGNAGGGGTGGAGGSSAG